MLKFTENEIEYTINDNNTASLSSASNFTGKELTVPQYIANNIPVVEISNRAFYRNENICNIILPSTVKNIGEYAFSWCAKLESVKISGAKIIASRAFMGCGKLKNITLPSSLKRIEEKAFSYCSSLVSVNLPDNIIHLGEMVFEGCRKLESVRLPKGLKILANGMFYACVSLRDVILPEYVDYIDEYAFAYCTSLVLPDIPASAVINESAFHECGDLRKRYIAS